MLLSRPLVIGGVASYLTVVPFLNWAIRRWLYMPFISIDTELPDWFVPEQPLNIFPLFGGALYEGLTCMIGAVLNGLNVLTLWCGRAHFPATIMTAMLAYALYLELKVLSNSPSMLIQDLRRAAWRGGVYTIRLGNVLSTSTTIEATASCLIVPASLLSVARMNPWQGAVGVLGMVLSCNAMSKHVVRLHLHTTTACSIWDFATRADVDRVQLLLLHAFILLSLLGELATLALLAAGTNCFVAAASLLPVIATAAWYVPADSGPCSMKSSMKNLRKCAIDFFTTAVQPLNFLAPGGLPGGRVKYSVLGFAPVSRKAIVMFSVQLLWYQGAMTVACLGLPSVKSGIAGEIFGPLRSFVAGDCLPREQVGHALFSAVLLAMAYVGMFARVLGLGTLGMLAYWRQGDQALLQLKEQQVAMRVLHLRRWCHDVEQAQLEGYEYKELSMDDQDGENPRPMSARQLECHPQPEVFTRDNGSVARKSRASRKSGCSLLGPPDPLFFRSQVQNGMLTLEKSDVPSQVSSGEEAKALAERINGTSGINGLSLNCLMLDALGPLPSMLSPKACAALKKLSFTECEFTEESSGSTLADILNRCPQVTSLRVDSCGLALPSLVRFAQDLAPHSALENLSLWGNPGLNSPKFIQSVWDVLKKCQNVLALDVGCCCLNWGSFRTMEEGQLPLRHGLKQIKLDLTNVEGFEGGTALAHFCNCCPYMASLDLRGVTYNTETFSALASVVSPMQACREVVSHGTSRPGMCLESRDGGMFMARFLNQCPSLAALVLDYTLTTEALVGVSMELAPHRMLAEVSLKENQFGNSREAGVALGKILSQSPNLIRMDIYSCNLGPAALSGLVESMVQQHVALKELILQFSELGNNQDTGTVLADVLERCPNLTSLNVAYCGIGPRALESMSGTMVSHQRLSELDLSYNEFFDTDQVGIHIAEIVNRCCLLHSLDLWQCRLGPKACASFAAHMVPHQTLAKLDIATADAQNLREIQLKCPCLQLQQQG